MTSLGRQQLALLTARRKSSRRVPCRVNGLAYRFRPGAEPRRNPCQALMREGGGYNEKPVSKAKLPLMFRMAVTGALGRRWDSRARAGGPSTRRTVRSGQAWRAENKNRSSP